MSFLLLLDPTGTGTVSGQFLGDAVLAARFFTADAVLLAPVPATFTGNSILKATLGGTFTADAYLVVTVPQTFTADATFKKVVGNISGIVPVGDGLYYSETPNNSFIPPPITSANIPTDLVAGDWIFVVAVVRNSGSTNDPVVNNTGGQTWTTSARFAQGNIGAIRFNYCVYNGGSKETLALASFGDNGTNETQHILILYRRNVLSLDTALLQSNSGAGNLTISPNNTTVPGVETIVIDNVGDSNPTSTTSLNWVKIGFKSRFALYGGNVFNQGTNTVPGDPGDIFITGGTAGRIWEAIGLRPTDSYLTFTGDAILKGTIAGTFTGNAKLKGASGAGGSGSGSSQTSTLVIDRPLGYEDGDALIAVVSDNQGSGATATALGAGWSTLGSRIESTTNLGQQLFIKQAGPTEPLTYSWTITGPGNTKSAGIILAAHDVKLTGIVTAGQANASSTSITAPSVTTTAANSLIIGTFSTAFVTTIDPPSGMLEPTGAEVSGAGSETGNGKNTVELSIRIQASAGASGTKVATAADAAVNIGHQIALEPLDSSRDDFTADSFFVPYFTGDAVFKKTVSGTFTGNGYLVGTFGATFTSDALLLTPVAGTFTGNSVLYGTLAGSYTADAVLLKTASATFTGDALIREASVEATYTANAVLLKTVSGNLTADALLLVITSQTFTGNAILLSTAQVAFSANAVLLTVLEATVTADARLLKIETAQFTADAIFFKTTEVQVSADAILLTTVESTITADARLRTIIEAPFTADAYLIIVVTVPFTADALLLSVVEVTFTADAKLYPAATRFYPPVLNDDRQGGTQADEQGPVINAGRQARPVVPRKQSPRG